MVPASANETDHDPDEAAAVELLRRLAGRIPDDTLRTLREQLAAWMWDWLTGSLVGCLTDARIALDDSERALLDQIAGPGAAGKIPETDIEFPAYRFSSEGPEPAEEEKWLVRTVSSLPVGRRLSAAYRRPANEAALPVATWVYLVEVDPGADIAHLQSQLVLGDATHGVVEVYPSSKTLPPYHVEALHAARAVWSRDT